MTLDDVFIKFITDETFDAVVQPVLDAFPVGNAGESVCDVRLLYVTTPSRYVSVRRSSISSIPSDEQLVNAVRKMYSELAERGVRLPDATGEYHLHLVKVKVYRYDETAIVVDDSVYHELRTQFRPFMGYGFATMRRVRSRSGDTIGIRMQTDVDRSPTRDDAMFQRFMTERRNMLREVVVAVGATQPPFKLHGMCCIDFQLHSLMRPGPAPPHLMHARRPPAPKRDAEQPKIPPGLTPSPAEPPPSQPRLTLQSSNVSTSLAEWMQTPSLATEKAESSVCGIAADDILLSLQMEVRRLLVQLKVISDMERDGQLTDDYRAYFVSLLREHEHVLRFPRE